MNRFKLFLCLLFLNTYVQAQLGIYLKLNSGLSVNLPYAVWQENGQYLHVYRDPWFNLGASLEVIPTNKHWISELGYNAVFLGVGISKSSIPLGPYGYIGEGHDISSTRYNNIFYFRQKYNFKILPWLSIVPYLGVSFNVGIDSVPPIPSYARFNVYDKITGKTSWAVFDYSGMKPTVHENQFLMEAQCGIDLYFTFRNNNYLFINSLFEKGFREIANASESFYDSEGRHDQIIVASKGDYWLLNMGFAFKLFKHYSLFPRYRAKQRAVAL